MRTRARARHAARVLAAGVGVVAVGVGGGCFLFLPPLPDPGDDPPSTCALVEPSDGAPIDVLFVVDNSGSMAEEQQALVAAFENDAGCPINDLKNVPAAFRNPSQAVLDGELGACGFVQVLAAFGVDFRIGVITTDVGLCDNRIPDSQGGDAWGFRPQRGCLQPNGPPGTSDKIIARADLDDADANNDDVHARFADTIENIATFGSPFERGLDAAAIFLGKESLAPNVECAGDLASFRRDGAGLGVVFVSDEDDCSHGIDSDFPDENSGEICGAFDSIVIEHSPADCYGDADTLSSPRALADAIRSAEPDAVVTMIVGALGSGADVAAAGCVAGVGGQAEGQCFETGGLSNFTGAGQPCDPSGPNGVCCTGDAGSRYFDFAQALGGRGAEASICSVDLTPALHDAAAAIARSCAHPG